MENLSEGCCHCDCCDVDCDCCDCDRGKTKSTPSLGFRLRLEFDKNPRNPRNPLISYHFITQKSWKSTDLSERKPRTKTIRKFKNPRQQQISYYIIIKKIPEIFLRPKEIKKSNKSTDIITYHKTKTRKSKNQKIKKIKKSKSSRNTLKIY